MNDLDERLAALNPMRTWPSPDLGSSEAEAIYERALAKYRGGSSTEVWYQAIGRGFGGMGSREALRRSVAVVLVVTVVVLMFVLPLPRLLHLGRSSRTGGAALNHPTTTGPPRSPGLHLRWRAKIPAGVVSMTLAYGSLWVTGEGAVSRVDPATGRVVTRVATPDTGEASGVAALAGALWVSSGAPGNSGDVLYEIDPSTNLVTMTFPTPGAASAMTAGAGLLWIDLYARNGEELRPFDPRTGEFLPPVVVTSESIGAPVFGLGSLWVTSAVPEGRVWKIDPSTMRASILLQTPSAPTLPLSDAGGPVGVTTEAGELWVSFRNGNVIARIDPRTGAVEHLFTVTSANGTITDGAGGVLWVLFQTGSGSSVVYDPAPSMPGGIGRIDPRTDTFEGKVLRIGGSGGYDSFVASGTQAWVGDLSHSTVIASAS